MKIINYGFLFLVSFFVLLSYWEVSAASIPLSIEGEYLIRFPGSSSYTKDNTSDFPENAIISIPDKKYSEPVNSVLDGCSLKLYPGVSFRISKGYFLPLTGRFEFISNAIATKSINIIGSNYNAGYMNGHFLIEVTPDNGVFFALKDKGIAWVKDSARKVFSLKNGQQVHIPMFGAGVIKNRLESFWGKAPSSYGALGEVGQETAYGIVGFDLSNNKVKNEKEQKDISEPDDEISEDDDLLDAQEELWLSEQ